MEECKEYVQNRCTQKKWLLGFDKEWVVCTSRKQQNALIIGESLDFLLLEIGGFNAGTFYVL